jgi:hypothetical protein
MRPSGANQAEIYSSLSVRIMCRKSKVLWNSSADQKRRVVERQRDGTALATRGTARIIVVQD